MLADGFGPGNERCCSLGQGGRGRGGGGFGSEGGGWLVGMKGLFPLTPPPPSAPWPQVHVAPCHAHFGLGAWGGGWWWGGGRIGGICRLPIGPPGGGWLRQTASAPLTPPNRPPGPKAMSRRAMSIASFNNGTQLLNIMYLSVLGLSQRIPH